MKLIISKTNEEANKDKNNHNRTQSLDRQRQISIKVIKKKKSHQESLPTIDIDTILNNHIKDKPKSINQFLLTSYINSLEDKQTKKPTHMHTISNIQIVKPTKSKITKTKQTTQSMSNKELEMLYKGIYSVRKDNPLYMLKKRNQSRPQVDSPLLLRDEMKDHLL